jgi:hypothetical protein
MKKTIPVLVSLLIIISMFCTACKSSGAPTPTPVASAEPEVTAEPTPSTAIIPTQTPTTIPAIETTSTQEQPPVSEPATEPAPEPPPITEPTSEPTPTPTPEPTPTPTPEPTPTPTPTPLRTEKITDATDDLMDQYNKKVTDEAYLDIVEAEILYFGTYYTVRIKLNEKLPTMTDPAYDIQYLLFIDGEGTPNIGWHYSLLTNDTSADYCANFAVIYGGVRIANMFDLWENITTGIEYKCTDDYIEMTFQAETIDKVKSFYFVIAACKTEAEKDLSEILVLDKIPNQGHGVFITKG